MARPSTSSAPRLPKKPPYKKRAPREYASNEDIERARELASRPVPASETCTWWMGARDYPERPQVCGRKPVVADWFKGRRRISCLCEQHDKKAAVFALKNPDTDHRRVPRW